MATNAILQPEPAPIIACTVSRDVQKFDLLIEDMENELGESCGDLDYSDALDFLDSPDGAALEFIAIAMDDEDETDIALVSQLVRRAVAKDVRALLIAESVSPITLHQLLQLGAQEFVPYPLPEGALHDAIERMRRPAVQEQDAETGGVRPKTKAPGDRNAVILPVQGLAGGTGSTNFAVNLAWELANLEGTGQAPKVCLIDLDFQTGSVATYLDLARRDAVFVILSDTAQMDKESFMQALMTYQDRLHVFTAPADMLPLDLVGPEDIERIIEMARTNFDYVVIDMPSAVVQWTETVLHSAHVFFAMMELDMRSAQNALRMIRALKSEELPYEKLRYVLNRGPKRTDLSGKSRVKRMAESLEIAIEVQLPDGSVQVSQACDHGVPLSEVAPKNPLRKEIQKLALSVHDLNQSVVASSN